MRAEQHQARAIIASIPSRITRVPNRERPVVGRGECPRTRRGHERRVVLLVGWVASSVLFRRQR